METNFKGTKGKWAQHKHAFCCVVSDKILVANCGVRTSTINTEELIREQEYNTRLIVDAGNVRQKINVDLPELLKQRNELIQVLKEIKEWWDSDDIMNDHLPIEKVTELITKIEQK